MRRNIILAYATTKGASSNSGSTRGSSSPININVTSLGGKKK